jgi:hypothetical protein
LGGAAGAVLAVSLATVAFAWGNITLQAECAGDDQSLSWSIQLPAGEDNYQIDWSFSADFSTFVTIDFGAAGDHHFTTPRAGSDLHVRWSSDHQTMAQAAASDELCASGTPTPTPEGTVKGGLGSPTSTPEGNVQGGTGTPAEGIPDTAQDPSSSAQPIPALVFGVVLVLSVATLALANLKVAADRR